MWEKYIGEGDKNVGGIKMWEARGKEGGGMGGRHVLTRSTTQWVGVYLYLYLYIYLYLYLYPYPYRYRYDI